MKFTFDRDAMTKEIAVTQEVITNKNALSILSNIYMSAEQGMLTIKATDSSVSFTTKIPVEIQEEGSTTIFCDKFMSILSQLPSGEISFVQEDVKVTIKPVDKKIKFELKSIASEKFPEISAADNVPFFELPAKEFKQMIVQTYFAVSEDTQRFFMTGVYFKKDNDNLIMVATDGRRLSFISKEIAQGVGDFSPAIVPTKILGCILKNASDEGNIMLAVIDKMIFAKFGNYEFSSLLLDGQFPNYEKVIPDRQNFSMSALKSDLEQALKRTTIMTDKKVNRLLFKISEGNLTLISPDSEIGNATEEIPCNYSGEEVTIAFNHTYISEPLKFLGTERLVLEFTEPMRAVTLRPDPAADYFHIIMPMNLN